MRLLLVYHAGASPAVRPLFQTLAARAGRLTVVVPERLRVDPVYDPSGWLRPVEDDGGGYRTLPVPLVDPGRYALGFARGELRRILRTEQPDVVHVLDEALSGYLFQTVRAARLVARRSRILFYGWNNVPPRLGRRALLKWRLIWSQLAGGAAANSEALAIVRSLGFPRRRPLRRIFWGVPTDRFRPLREPSLRERLGVRGARVLGYVGRLTPEKGVEDLLAAAAELPREVHVLLVGAGPLRARLEERAAGADLRSRVGIVDPVAQDGLPAYLNCLDALVLPSRTTARWKEQYGRVLAEAMACGVPVVGTDSGAIPEVVGDAGVIVPEGDRAALAAACQRVLYDDRARDALRQRGLERARAQLSVEAMVNGLERLYGEVA